MRAFSFLIFSTVFFVLFNLQPSMASESKLTYLPTVSNLPIHIFESQNASAHIIGFVGGNGLKNKSGISKNYIVKQRSVFVNSGINFYLFPNFDQNEKASYKLRASQKRIKRIRALIKFIKEADDKPIYLLGFSRGSVDAGAFSKSHPALIEGIILMSGVYKNKSKKAHDFSMDKIIGTKTSVTTLLVHHEKDLCKVTKFAEAKKFYANLSSPKKMMLTFSDGEGSGKACGPKNFHSYEKIEAYVARSVAQWIIENLPHK